MHWKQAMAAGVVLVCTALAVADVSKPSQPCTDDGTACAPSKKDLQSAKAAYTRGVKLQAAKKFDEALHELSDAVEHSPRNTQYLTAREMLRQQLVFDHMQRGNVNLLDGHQIEALAEFRAALDLDPQNAYAQQRLRDAAGNADLKQSSLPLILANSGEIRVNPAPLSADFHYAGDGRTLLTQIATTFGLTAVFDDSVVSRTVRFDITNVDFFTAMQAACAVTKSLWIPLSEKQFFLAADTPDNHRTFDRMVLRTFYLPGFSGNKDFNDIANLLRNLFDVRFITTQPAAGTVVVRASQGAMDAVTTFMESLDDARPQVMLDMRVYQISHTFVRNMGIHLPNQFQMFNIPAGALAGLGGQNIQDLINQLISSGGINQANSSAISALLAQLQNQQNSILSQPVVTFGNGLTLMGLSLGTASIQMYLNESNIKTLEHVYLRTSQGDDAVFRVGARYPILNATFAPIFNTAAISKVVQNNSFQAPFPSINYEDIGLGFKAKPTISGNSDVTLNLEMQFRALTAQSIDGIPVISNREYKGTITLREGESGVVAGSISRMDSRSMSGIPGFGSVPGLNKLLTSNNKQETDDELLLVVTPYVISGRERSNSEVWLKQ
jgi:hypothetical protein